MHHYYALSFFDAINTCGDLFAIAYGSVEILMCDVVQVCLIPLSYIPVFHHRPSYAPTSMQTAKSRQKGT